MPSSKPDLNPAFITRAETQCEGVRPRLSDARHTQKDEEKEMPELLDRSVLVGR